MEAHVFVSTCRLCGLKYKYKYSSLKVKAKAKHLTHKAKSKAKYVISVLKHRPGPNKTPSTNSYTHMHTNQNFEFSSVRSFTSFTIVTDWLIDWMNDYLYFEAPGGLFHQEFKTNSRPFNTQSIDTLCYRVVRSAKLQTVP